MEDDRMEYRYLGQSGLKVSAMSLGTNSFGVRADEATSIAIVHKALDSGINLLDTADIYNNGESERILGLALKGRRSEAVVATKVNGRMGEGPNNLGNSRQHILDGVDASLKRLGTDYIDLYQLHNWDSLVPVAETLRVLDDLVRWGKVRYVGCSNWAAWQIVKALGLSDRNGWARFVSNQPEYSPVNRIIEREIIPAGISEGVGQIVYFPLAGGLFSGKYRRDTEAPAGSRALTQGARFANRFLIERNFTVVEQLEKVAAEVSVSLPNLVLAWAMAKPGISSVIVGATKVEQLVQNLGATDVKLSAEVIQQVDEISASFA
jgi:aryl-alcohol dehydrogenase-like predicted oxidoreductase